MARKKQQKKKRNKQYRPKYVTGGRVDMSKGGRVSLAHGGQPTPPIRSDYPSDMAFGKAMGDYQQKLAKWNQEHDSTNSSVNNETEEEKVAREAREAEKARQQQLARETAEASAKGEVPEAAKLPDAVKIEEAGRCAIHVIPVVKSEVEITDIFRSWDILLGQ